MKIFLISFTQTIKISIINIVLTTMFKLEVYIVGHFFSATQYYTFFESVKVKCFVFNCKAGTSGSYTLIRNKVLYTLAQLFQI